MKRLFGLLVFGLLFLTMSVGLYLAVEDKVPVEVVHSGFDLHAVSTNAP